MKWPVPDEVLNTGLKMVRFRGKTGSSASEVNTCIELAVIYSIVTAFLVNILFQTRKSNYSFLIFMFEFFGCIFPLVISLTYLSDYLYYIYEIFLCIFVAFFVWLLNRRDLWSMLLENVRIKDDKLPCITHFRALVNVFSVICILAADFNVFPERFLKTEHYGYSLMDTGVGLFVVTSALGGSHSRLGRISLSTFYSHFILLSIGIGRYFAVRSVDYHKVFEYGVHSDYHHQVYEYGVHWNFFVTLALVGIFNEFLLRLMNSTKNIFIFSIVLLISYEFALNVGLRDWIFGTAPRDDFISANREGICSIAGYEVLYLWGVIMKRFLPKKGDVFGQYQKATAIYLKSNLFIACFNSLTSAYFPPSRRCANAGYVLWIMKIVLFHFSIFIFVELIVLLWNIRMKIKINRTTPFILESVNFNGLLFFLLANLLTGLINLSMHTLLIWDNLHCYIIITLYIFTCCSVASLLYAKRWRIR